MRRINDELFRVIASAPLLPHRWRPGLLRLGGVACGSGALIFGGLRIVGDGEVAIASDVFINWDCYIDSVGGVEIRRGSRIGDHVRLLTTTHELGDAQRRAGRGVSAPVIIETGVWLGSGVTVMPGVTVASGCVIGATSTVTHSTDPNGLYVGVPARRVRELHAECGARD